MATATGSTAASAAMTEAAQLTPGETSASFMARADAALYEAKRAGRDCVRVSRVEQIIDDGRSSVR